MKAIIFIDVQNDFVTGTLRHPRHARQELSQNARRPRKLYDTSFNIADITGNTVADMIRASFPSANVLLSVDGEDDDENDKIIFRAFVR